MVLLRIYENFNHLDRKIAKFFWNNTFPVTALQAQNQMTWFKFLLINVHHNSLSLEGYKKIRQIGGAATDGVLGNQVIFTIKLSRRRLLWSRKCHFEVKIVSVDRYKS